MAKHGLSDYCVQTSKEMVEDHLSKEGALGLTKGDLHLVGIELVLGGTHQIIAWTTRRSYLYNV